MFITAGSCSVMLLCPTRRIFFCHGSVDASMAARRGGSGTILVEGAPTVEPATLSAESVEAGSRRLIAAVTAALFFRKVRRLSILLLQFFCRRSLNDRSGYGADGPGMLPVSSRISSTVKLTPVEVLAPICSESAWVVKF